MATRLEGQERLRRKLAKLAEIQGPVRKRIRDALAQNGAEISGQMRAVAPSRTGALRASIRAVFGEFRQANANVRGAGGQGAGDPDLTLRIVAGDAKAWYARLVEFGTAPHVNGGRFAGSLHPGSSPRPFFYPVYRANKRRARSRLTRAIKAGIRETVG